MVKKASGGKGMEPPDLDVGDQSTNNSTKETGAHSVRFPEIRQLRTAQLRITDDSARWLEACRRLAELRLPPEVFKSVPDDIWKYMPWGTKVVVARAPKIGRHGQVIVPETSQRSQFHGWVLTVGPDICDWENPDQIVRGKTCPYWAEGIPPKYSPLLLVGEMVQFNPHAGREVSTARALSPEREREFLITSIADIWGPIPVPDERDWATTIDSEPTVEARRIIT